MITPEGAVSKLKGNRNSSWAREDRHLGPQCKQQTWSQGRGLLVLCCWLEYNPEVRNNSWYNHCQLLLLASQGATGETWCPVEHLERSLLCRGGRGEKQLVAACPSGVKETPWGNCLKNRVSSPSEGPPPWLITHWCSWCFAGARSESAALAEPALVCSKHPSSPLQRCSCLTKKSCVCFFFERSKPMKSFTFWYLLLKFSCRAFYF